MIIDILQKFQILGHASLVGVKTGKVIGYDTRTKVCSICNYHIGRNHTVPSHDCNIDWRGRYEVYYSS